MSTTPVPHRMTIEADGARLYAEVAGEGPPLLCVSGSGSALNEEYGPASSPLSRHFTVAAYDHRGLGRSTSQDRPLTMADFAEDAFTVADALGWEKFALFGPSFGGMVAQRMAVSRPSRIRRLVLCGTSSGGPGGSSYPLHERPEPLRMAMLFDTRPKMWEGLVSLISGTEPPHEPGYERQLRARATHDVWSRLPAVTAPTLVTSGRYDAIAPPGNGAAIASRIHGARHEVFEGGHAFMYEDARAWPVTLEFLRGA
ncbi:MULTISPECIES: alpha/beta fold hydrolase [unclassified Streptomyces]|uniref:alpha/beta fold hydrolase n=1 Tax=unclassified Streptomyces TaxID=2593676 RepID=UPI00382915AC